MPKRKKVWSSWNFLTNEASDDPTRPAPVTYWMNRLQTIPQDTPLFVSLNPYQSPDPDLVHDSFDYDHPVFEAGTFQAQRDVDTIQGLGGIWYAGAWLGYGFHEDGLRSGLRVATALGAEPRWMAEAPEPFEPILKAAE
jgi:predicted NAD/FAD-binding protein